MYKKLIKILVLFSVCLAANACKIIPDEDVTYKVETGEVEKSVYTVAEGMKESYGSNITFSKIKIIREYLKVTTPSIYYGGIESEFTKDEIRQFLTKLDSTATTSVIEREIAFLVSNGNTLLYFSSETSESMKRWVYIQKE